MLRSSESNVIRLVTINTRTGHLQESPPLSKALMVLGVENAGPPVSFPGTSAVLAGTGGGQTKAWSEGLMVALTGLIFVAMGAFVLLFRRGARR
jgi:hypothetical protein